MKKTASDEKHAERFQKLLLRENELLKKYPMVAGVDEAGRGPLAGPVVCAAAMRSAAPFREEDLPWLMAIYDSKQLTERQREEVFVHLMSPESPLSVSVAKAEAEEIDETNILKATHRAMKSAVDGLPEKPGFVLVDGTAIPDLDIPQEKIIKGDSLCLCIAAASIAAKVTRDHIMLELDKEFPEYGFAKHKGYGTAFHLQALRRHGRSSVHRRTFYVEGLDPKRERGAEKRTAGGGPDGRGTGKEGLSDNSPQLSLFEE
ncbi:ribonuclease HII [bacterium]|nr:ribonuclease HII [bacterium]